MKILKILTLLSCLLLAACATTPPKNPNNAYHIFKEKPRWYYATQKSANRYNVPMPVLLAIVHQESRFINHAKPPRTKLLWLIPWRRPSSASGYSQALEGTWREYQHESGHFTASRHSFADAIDFVAWFSKNVIRELNLNPNDAKNIYLAYHEGIGGYKRKTYLKKPSLIKVANRVQLQANRYQTQLNQNAHRLHDKHWWHVWL